MRFVVGLASLTALACTSAQVAPNPVDASVVDTAVAADAYGPGPSDAEADAPDVGGGDAALAITCGGSDPRPGPGVLCCDGASQVALACVAPHLWGCPAPGSANDVAAWDACGSATLAEPELGVPCFGGPGGWTSCTAGQHCWETVVDEGCVDAAPTTYYRDWTCDGPEDCGTGQCCVTASEPPTGGVVTFRTGCADACATSEGVMCNVDADCGLEQRCCATRLRWTAGVCRASCAE